MLTTAKGELDTKKIAAEWGQSVALMRKPKLKEACDVILDLCVEIVRIRRDLADQKNKDLLRDNNNQAMINEIIQTVSKYK